MISFAIFFIIIYSHYYCTLIWCSSFLFIQKLHTKIKYQYSPGPSGGPGDSESLKACQSLLDEYLPKLKALPGAQVTRQVCGGCLDFKVSITQPLDEHGAWAEEDYGPLEGEFMEKLKAIDGTSLHETQEITFETL